MSKDKWSKKSDILDLPNFTTKPDSPQRVWCPPQVIAKLLGKGNANDK
jgi:hypothetical protein